VFRGAGLVNSGQLHGANLALVVLAVMASFEAVMPLPAAYQFLGRTRQAGRRLLEIVDAAPAVVYPAQSAADPPNGGIAFERVVFGYRSEDLPVLTGVDFTVAEGERIAVLGSTGAGKSTLIYLLVRFWDPQSGKIRLGGEDIRNFSEAQLRGHLSVVSQQAHVFNASIRDNLRIARPQADDAQLWEALEAVQLDGFVRSLPDGLGTWTGESGKLLSGGQARRLSVARAVLHAAPVWVLDEPTEGLDRETERRLMNTLFPLTAGRTVLLITHRLEDLQRMNRILILEQGRIVEDGTHEQLLRLGGRYAGHCARLKM
jgi:ATP-binding cassette subfamily C protein CydC